MTTMIRIAARHSGGMFRAGRHWPEEGVEVAPDELSKAQIALIRSDPNLRVTELGRDTLDEALRETLVEVIGKLAVAEFQQDGKPKLDALRKALPDHKAGITAQLRDEVWAGLARPGPPAPGE